ncbi:MAG: ATP-binding protein [Steroidobacteraceae bacterium]
MSVMSPSPTPEFSGVADQSRGGALRALATALLLSQLCFWIGLGAAEYLAKPRGALPQREALLQLAEPDGSFAAEGSLIPVPLQVEPGYAYRDAERRPGGRFLHYFDVDDPAAELALFLGYTRRIEEVRLNGQILKAQTSAESWAVMGGFQPATFLLPPEFLRSGRNELAIKVSGRSLKILPVFYLADAGKVISAHRWARLFSVDLVVASIGIMLFVVLLLLTTDWPAGDRQRVNALAVLLLAWTLRNLSILDIDDGLPDSVRLLFSLLVTYGFLAALLAFVFAWAGHATLGRRLALGVLAVATAIAVIANLGGTRLLFAWGQDLETLLTQLIAITGAVLLLRRHATHPQGTLGETVLFLICLTAVMVDDLDNRLHWQIPGFDWLPLTFYAAPMCGILLALGMNANLAAQTARSRRLALARNEELQRELAEREREIAAAYAARQALERDAALSAERQRLVRDMHDGVGGQLVSLLLATRNNSLTRGQLIDALQTTVEDLRLIVQSLDSAGDSLEEALARFRERATPRIEAAGIEVQWRIDAQARTLGFGPTAILQIYRALQEMCTNVLRHAAARRIEIGLRVTGVEGEQVTLSVADDGVGVSPNARMSGQGLRSLHDRAAQLGGGLTIGAGLEGRGTCFELTIPIPAR